MIYFSVLSNHKVLVTEQTATSFGDGVFTGPELFGKPVADLEPGVYDETGKRLSDSDLNKRSDNMDDFNITADITKLDDDQHLVFGWASVANSQGEPLVDLQGDVITDAELEKAAHSYVLESRKGGVMHEREADQPKQVGKLVESIVFTAEKQKALGIDLGKTGWWVGFKVDDPATWAKVKSGEYSGFSIHGKGIREAAE